MSDLSDRTGIQKDYKSQLRGLSEEFIVRRPPGVEFSLEILPGYLPLVASFLLILPLFEQLTSIYGYRSSVPLVLFSCRAIIFGTSRVAVKQPVSVGNYIVPPPASLAYTTRTTPNATIRAVVE
jgi:hypothetical protein